MNRDTSTRSLEMAENPHQVEALKNLEPVKPIIIHELSDEDKTLIDNLHKEIKGKQKENQVLEEQLTQVQKMLTSSVNESKVIRSLKEEISRQKTLLVERDHKVTELLESEKLGREHKESILKDLELVKGQREV